MCTASLEGYLSKAWNRLVMHTGNMCYVFSDMHKNMLFKMLFSLQFFFRAYLLTIFQVYSFLSNLLIHWCSWLLTVTIIECCVFTRNPMQVHQLATRERSKNILLVVLLLSVCVNGHYFWTFGLQEAYNMKDVWFCQFTTVSTYYSESFRDYLWPTIDFMLAIFIPGLIMFCCVIDVIRHKYNCCQSRVKQMHNRVQNINQKVQITGYRIRDNKLLLDGKLCEDFVFTCVILCLCSFIFTLPQTTFDYIFEFLIIEKLGYMPDDYTFESKRQLARTVCTTFKDIFHALKIIIYVIFMPSFRTTVKQLFCCQHKMPKEKYFEELIVTENSVLEEGVESVCASITVL